MNNSPSVLIFGKDLDLIGTRQLVLQYAGFDVMVASSLDQALRLLASRSFNLFLLCHSLSSADYENALRQAHALRPETKNLVLTNTLTNRTVDKRDNLLAAFPFPQTLIAAANLLTGSVGSRGPGIGNFDVGLSRGMERVPPGAIQAGKQIDP